MLKLTEMLRYRRPAGSRTEKEFIRRYLDTVPGMQSDAYGNRMLIHPTSRTIIACHTDTVHRTGGKQWVSQTGNTIALAKWEKQSNCLGADDTTGVYACLRMIEAKVPATFIFHRAEEIGGRGSSWLADEYPDWLRGFDRCVSLDRRGTSDVIEYQSWSRCCSRTFALALAASLSMGHKPAEGIFTDSANYTRLIPECSNISVGYANEHTGQESLDVEYLERLIVRLCKIDWESLPAERDPSATDDWSLDWGYKTDYSYSDRVKSSAYLNPDVTDYEVAVECDYCAGETTVTYQVDGFEICPDCLDREYTYEEYTRRCK